ncbi:hypothetical protein BDL97_15G072500 [Sphagnum fallax]|nr:hypothetical protein BDL97_15G072500 [Sphagnum fallax]
MAKSVWSTSFLLLLLASTLLLQQSLTLVTGATKDEEEAAVEAGGGAARGEDPSQVGLLDEQISGASSVVDDLLLGPAAGVNTVFYFPENPTKSVGAGEPAEILVGISNNGDEALKVILIQASLTLPYDHRIYVQNFTAQEFGSTIVPSGIQASFPYSFTVNKFLQPGSFDLVASVVYELGEQLHKSVFYNGTVEVVEASGFVSGETVFLITLGLGLLGLLGMWVYSQVQRLSKKSRRTTKVETGTRVSVDAANNEWLQGTSFTQKVARSISQQNKSRKKK